MIILTYKEAIQDIRRRNARYYDQLLTRKVNHGIYSINNRYAINSENSVDEKTADITNLSKSQEKTQNKTKATNPIITFKIPAGTKIKLLNSVILYSDSDINLNAELLNEYGNDIIKYITNLTNTEK